MCWTSQVIQGLDPMNGRICQANGPTRHVQCQMVLQSRLRTFCTLSSLKSGNHHTNMFYLPFPIIRWHINMLVIMIIGSCHGWQPVTAAPLFSIFSTCFVFLSVHIVCNMFGTFNITTCTANLGTIKVSHRYLNLVDLYLVVKMKDDFTLMKSA